MIIVSDVRLAAKLKKNRKRHDNERTHYYGNIILAALFAAGFRVELPSQTQPTQLVGMFSTTSASMPQMPQEVCQIPDLC